MATTTLSADLPAARTVVVRALLALIAAGALFACLSAPAQAESVAGACNLYASTTGSDANPGTQAAPVLTVKRLIGKLGAGQTGCLTSGQTFAGFTLHGGESHGAEGAPVTITSTNPNVPATIDTRVTTTSGANWLTFTHLTLVSDVLTNNEDPSPTINSAHTSWTNDDISGNDLNICILPSQPTSFGQAEYTLVEHDRVHDCGHPVTKPELEAQESNIYEGRLNGWHAHGIYDEGFHTTISNNYFYDNSSKGILLRGGSYAVVEHNIVDHNGSGILFGDNGPNHDVVAWNIVTNSTSPCHTEAGSCDDFGVWSYCHETCVADSFIDNDVAGNQDGNVAPSYDLCSCIEVQNNVEADPLYVNAAAHNYALQARSPVVGYGPDTAQPSGAPATQSPPAQSVPSPESAQPAPATQASAATLAHPHGGDSITRFFSKKSKRHHRRAKASKKHGKRGRSSRRSRAGSHKH
jgi:parallel beta-helix repeat protein